MRKILVNNKILYSLVYSTADIQPEMPYTTTMHKSLSSSPVISYVRVNRMSLGPAVADRLLNVSQDDHVWQDKRQRSNVVMDLESDFLVALKVASYIRVSHYFATANS